MPKYFDYKVFGYYLYFTSHCVVEAMHVHASDRQLREAKSAKFFVTKDGEAILQKKGDLSDREIKLLEKFVKQHYQGMYLTWRQKSDRGFYGQE